MLSSVMCLLPWVCRKALATVVGIIVCEFCDLAVVVAVLPGAAEATGAASHGLGLLGHEEPLPGPQKQDMLSDTLKSQARLQQDSNPPSTNMLLIMMTFPLMNPSSAQTLALVRDLWVSLCNIGFLVPCKDTGLTNL